MLVFENSYQTSIHYHPSSDYTAPYKPYFPLYLFHKQAISLIDVFVTTFSIYIEKPNPQVGHPLLTCHNRGAITLYHSTSNRGYISHPTYIHSFFKPRCNSLIGKIELVQRGAIATHSSMSISLSWLMYGNTTGQR